MVADETPAARALTGDKRHDHHLPQNHAAEHRHVHTHDHGRPHLHLATTSGMTVTTFTPGFSILRASLFLRLGFALVATILVWAAFHWATQ